MLLIKVWKNQPGKYFCISTRDRFKHWEDHFFKRSEFSEIPDFIAENQDKDVYWCPHGFSKPRRLEQNAEIPKMLWADLDAVDPRDLIDLKLMPTIAWESSPKRYCGIWYIDTFMTKELNQALTYHIKADKGGWDITQVLRVPGTKNYKYEDAPKVKLMWDDGEEYKTSHIERMLPKEKPKSTKATDAAGIYKKYEKKFSTFVRRELIKGKPVPGKRSEVIWKLVHEIIEAGASRDEAFELLRGSPWNKFKQRRDGDKQLRREIDKAIDQHLSVSVDNKKTFREEERESNEDDDEDDKPKYQFLTRTLDDFEAEEIDWLWYPYLARGEMTILEGDPGVGKSYLAQMISLGIADGKKLPSNKPHKNKGIVAYFDMENSPGHTTKKRMNCNGLENGCNFLPDPTNFSIDNEGAMEAMDEAIRRLKPALVVFDTINSYIGTKTDTYRSAEVQEALKGFVDLARRHKCAVLILRHLTKGKDVKAIYRGQGSIAFTGMARVVMTCAWHPEEEGVRVLAVTKINVCAAPRAMTFTIDKLPDKLNEEDRSKFEWGDYVDLSSDDLLNAEPIKKESGDKVSTAETFLETVLEGGPMEQEQVLRAGEAKAITERTIYRAMKTLGIVKTGEGFGTKRRTMWSLPGAKAKSTSHSESSTSKRASR
jgi:archaellum biogenesis ATPase FlaH